MGKTLGLFILLSIFWGINSANDSPLLLVYGLVSIVLVLFLSRRMQLPDSESFPQHLFSKIIPFYLWLIKEIVIGNIYVIKTILTTKRKPAPGFVQVKLAFKHPLTEVIFANSVTLVPGTLSVELKHDHIQIHTLTQELADQLVEGDLIKRIKRLES